MANTRRAAKPTLDSLLKSASLPERTVPVCVRGDLVAEVERLERSLSDMNNEGDLRFTGNAEARKIAEKIESIRQEMTDSTIEFTLRALGRRAFQKFHAEHPPRDGNASDAQVGFNTETYYDDLVRRSIVSPELDEEQWDALVEVLTAAQWTKFVEAAAVLNMDGVSVPFSASASRILRASAES